MTRNHLFRGNSELRPRKQKVAFKEPNDNETLFHRVRKARSRGGGNELQFLD